MQVWTVPILLLFDDEGRVALRARLGDGHVRSGEIAIGVARATVENARAAAATFSGAAALHKFAITALRAFDAHGDGASVFALGIVGTADEVAVAAVFFDEVNFAAKLGTFRRVASSGWQGDAGAFDKAAGGFAIGVAGAGQENAEAAALDGHFLAAIVAVFNFGRALGS